MRRYIHALTAILLLFTTLTPARPAYKQVPQDLDHDGENDWAEVTVTHAEIHDRPIHQITHTKNWPFYTLEIRMKDGKKYMDQSSSLTSHCHNIGAGRKIHSASFDDGLVEKHLFLYEDEHCKTLTDKLGNGLWRFADIDRSIGSWMVD